MARADLTLGERLVVEMRAWVEAGGDAYPTEPVRSSDGYTLGKQLGRAHRGELPLTDTQWAELETLGTRRENDLTPGERLMVEMRAWVEAGGDPNPTGRVRTSEGYGLSKQLGRACRGELQLTDTQWAELETLGTRREMNVLSAGERLMVEMRAWTDAGGDPSPLKSDANIVGLSPR